MHKSYGCELWLLSNIHIKELCISCQKGLRRVWRLPYKTHCYLLPLLSQCLSLEGEICRWSLNLYVSACATVHVKYGINYGRCNLFLGFNAMFCFSKFNMNICNICGGVVNVRRAVGQYAERKVKEHEMQAADFLCEILFVRDNHIVPIDNHLVLSNNVDFNLEELIDFIGTN